MEPWPVYCYGAMALGHCGECHTPRGALGGLQMDQHLAGTREGQWGIRVPNITPDAETGIGGWSQGNKETFLATGRKPDGSYTTSLMREVQEATRMRLTNYDNYGLALYLSSLPIIHNNLDVTEDPFNIPDYYE